MQHHGVHNKILELSSVNYRYAALQCVHSKVTTSQVRAAHLPVIQFVRGALEYAFLCDLFRFIGLWRIPSKEALESLWWREKVSIVLPARLTSFGVGTKFKDVTYKHHNFEFW